MLTLDSNSRIRIRSKKESVIWIVLLVVMSSLLCAAIVLATWFGAGALFGPPEGGAWWAYSELPFPLGEMFLRFVDDTHWEGELTADCIFGLTAVADGGTLKWATGEYRFGEDGEGVPSLDTLYIKMDVDGWDLENGSPINTRNVSLLNADKVPVPNGTWVALEPDEDGIYIVRLALTSSGDSGEDISNIDLSSLTFVWLFKPKPETEPGYDRAAEQKYLEENGL